MNCLCISLRVCLLCRYCCASYLLFISFFVSTFFLIFHFRAWYSLQEESPNAIRVSDVCKTRLLVSSFFTRNVGEDGPNLASNSMWGSLLVSVSTWYWQHGSNCQETVYKPQVTNAIQPKGMQMYGRSFHIRPNDTKFSLYYLCLYYCRTLNELINFVANIIQFF